MRLKNEPSKQRGLQMDTDKLLSSTCAGVRIFISGDLHRSLSFAMNSTGRRIRHASYAFRYLWAIARRDVRGRRPTLIARQQQWAPRRASVGSQLASVHSEPTGVRCGTVAVCREHWD